MAEKWKNIISKAIGVEPIFINSNLVSAQNRKRLYWTNINCINKPLDMNIKLEDILMRNKICNIGENAKKQIFI